MPLLASKWATAEPETVSKVSSPKKASIPSASSKPVVNKLPSKWADAPDPTPQHQNSSKSTHVQLPTPPSSAGNSAKSGVNGRSERTNRRRSEGRSERALFDHKNGSNHHKQDHKDKSYAHEPASRRKSSHSDSGKTLASRLGSISINDDKSGHRDNQKPRRGHAGRESRAGKSPERHARKSLGSSDESEEERPSGTMTAAAQSFALRIGVPVQDTQKNHHHTTTRNANVSKTHNFGDNGTPGREKGTPTGSSSRYMTPKQKRALEEQEKQAKLTKEQELKEAKLKAEVQSMFEKMSDKSSSWADLEDESD
ncbi:hypothetical protein OXX69_004341 [Metschnikowia pulcherrima]